MTRGGKLVVVVVVVVTTVVCVAGPNENWASEYPGGESMSKPWPRPSWSFV